MKTLIVDCIARGGKPNRNIFQKAKDIKREILTEKYGRTAPDFLYMMIGSGAVCVISASPVSGEVLLSAGKFAIQSLRSGPV